jgi:hypothetical protein
MRHTSRIVCIVFVLLSFSVSSLPQQPTSNARDDDYLSWTADQANDVGKRWRVNGRVGGALDLRVIHTEHAYNYKLRATLMAPEVIRATARLEQLRMRLTDAQTRELIAEAEKTEGLVVLVEIDPQEGSGVIPLEWRSALRPKGAKEDSSLTIPGINTPALRQVKALAGVARRDYAYDVFWVVFPLKDQQGKPIWEAPPDAMELLVGIYNKEGRVSWPVSEQLRQHLINSKR